MKKIFTGGYVISFLLFLSLFFTSCSHIDMQAEDLIGIPSVPEKMDTVNCAIKEYCGEDAELVYVSNGKNLNPIVYNDIDGDGISEIIVVHRNPQSENGERVNLAVFTQDGDEIVELFHISGNGYDVDKYEIADLNGDGVSEIIIGYQMSEIIKNVYVYSFDLQDKTYNTCVNLRYTDWVITDIDSDGKDDIVLLYYDTIRDSAYASVIKNSVEDRISEVSWEYTPLSMNSGFYRMLVSTDSNGKKSVLVSAKQGTYLSSLEVLTWDEEVGNLVNISYSERAYNSPVDNIHSSFCSVGSYIPTDINNDGFIEFPICDISSEADIQYNLIRGSEMILNLYRWYRYEDGLVKVMDSYISNYNNYVFVIDPQWSFSRVDVFENYNREMLFYYVESDRYLFDDDSEKKILLFTIKTSEKKVELSEYKVPLGDYNGIYYYVEINPKVPERIQEIIPSGEDLAKAFILQVSVAADN